VSAAAEPRFKVGVDVPWVTSWSGEAMTGVAPCPSVDGMIAVGQQSAAGQGKPLYSRNHLFRQRLSVRSLLCPMCGEATHEGDRWSQTGRAVTAAEVKAKGLGDWLPADFTDDRPLFDAGAIAPLHRACAERALLHCPHLKGMDDRELKPFPGAWIVVPLMIQAQPPMVGNVPRPMVAAVSFLQLIGVPDWAAA
jgi:hypothetical protein